ncbi:MAG: magnesium transporter [Kiritimatiellaceae bacterium]|nr:magnesium transporter [Kiritimatiellaceae bacterium]
MDIHSKDPIQYCIRNQCWSELPELLSKLHPADIADIIEHSPADDQPQIFDSLSDELKAAVLSEMADATEADLLEDLTPEEICDIVDEMAPDDAADLLGELEDTKSAEVLQLMDKEDSAEVRELLSYAEDTAGGLMNTDFVALHGTKTAQQALDHISQIDTHEPVYSAYVIDAERRLIGHVGIWLLLRNENRQKKLEDLTESLPFYVHTGTDQEDVAQMMTRYNLNSLPVLDDDDRLVGRITIDDIMDVLEEEASEDIFKLAGSSEEELEYSSPLQASRARLPWLLITLTTGFVTSMILKLFMQRISLLEVLALSFFVPIVMGMGGNTGIQSSTLIIRGLAIGSFNEQKLYRLLFRELATGMLMGVICGSVIGVWARFVIGDSVTAFSPTFLAFTVGLALFSAMMFAAVFGAFVPLALNRFKIDPAVASGPFVSASNDIFALLIYYSVTFLLIGTHAA